MLKPDRLLARWAIALSLAWLAGCAPLRYGDALLVLGDLAAGEGPSRLKQVTPEPSRTPVTYTVAGRPRTGDLYLPRDDKPQAGIVLVPGAVPKGKDDARLVVFARTLARARFAVLAPEIRGHRDLRIRATDAREVADAFSHLASREDLAPGGRAGIGAFSYAVGPALLAALEDDVRPRVRFVVGVGGYYDLSRALRFFTTGYFDDEHGVRRRLEPDEYGKLVFAMSVRDHLGDANDRAILDGMVAAKLADRAAGLAPLAERLTPEGMSVYRLLTNTDPGEFGHLFAALPPETQATIGALTLHDKALERLTGRLILVHGKNDTLIPYPESVALGQAVPPSRARVFIINRILGHVDLALSHILTRRFWSEELPDAWRLFRAVDSLLREREAPAPGEA